MLFLRKSNDSEGQRSLEHRGGEWTIALGPPPIESVESMLFLRKSNDSEGQSSL